jgi:type II secretory pathway pseudopilin PulG
MKRLIRSSNRPVAPRGAFTVMEMMVASAMVAIIVAGLFASTTFFTNSLQAVTRQNLLNDRAAAASEFILSRVRLAMTMTNDAGGNTLTLEFDDNPEVDSNGDGKAYNDVNHVEKIMFLSGDNDDGTTANNRLVHVPDTTSGITNTLLAEGVRKLTSFKVFSLTNQNSVLINFGLLGDDGKGRYQAVEIRTRAVRRNKPD